MHMSIARWAKRTTNKMEYKNLLSSGEVFFISLVMACIDYGFPSVFVGCPKQQVFQWSQATRSGLVFIMTL